MIKILTNKKILLLILFIVVNIFTFLDKSDEVVFKKSTSSQTTLENFERYLPSKKNNVLFKKGFIVDYNNRTKNPNWVFYTLTDNFLEKHKRPSSFYEDPQIPSKYRVISDDFKHSGYDRGHLAPNDAISRVYGVKAQLETFYMSNISPQNPDLNRGLWKSLEQIVINDFVKRYNQVHVFCGPIFFEEYDVKFISSKKIWVPDAFYKIVLLEKNQSYKTISVIMPQEIDKQHKLMNFFTSIDNIEDFTNIDFLQGLEDELETRLEKFVAKKLP